MDAALMGCGFGGVGPVAPPGVPNAWVVALLEISPHGAQLSGVRVMSVTLLDADDAVLARAISVDDVRVAPSTRARFDFSKEGTSPFGGAIVRPTVLRVGATLDTRAEVLYPRAQRPTRARIDIIADGGLHRVAEGAASPWPTA